MLGFHQVWCGSFDDAVRVDFTEHGSPKVSGNVGLVGNLMPQSPNTEGNSLLSGNLIER